MGIAAINLEDNLDLQAIVTCDSSAVKGYLLTADISTLDQKSFKFDTSKYTCGDKARIQQKKIAAIILI